MEEVNTQTKRSDFLMKRFVEPVPFTQTDALQAHMESLFAGDH